MPAAILGDRASGKTTFLGLLYSAQVIYGTGPKDDFRFHAPPMPLKMMSGIYESMKGGIFPPATLKEQMSEISFKFGYLGKLTELLPGPIQTRLKEKRWFNPWVVLKFGAYDVSGEDIEEFIETGVSSSSIISELLKSTIVVVIVDCAKLTVDTTSPLYKRMLNYDSKVAQLLVSFQTYKAEEYKRMKQQDSGTPSPVVYPAFVLAKVDMLREEVLAKLGLPPTLPPLTDRRKRKEYAEKLLRVFMPQTLSQIRGGKIAGVAFDEAAYFLSWVKTEAVGGMAPAGPPKIVRKEIGPGRGAEIDFSYDEYVAFIEHFRRVAKKVPDDTAEKADDIAKSS